MKAHSFPDFLKDTRGRTPASNTARSANGIPVGLLARALVTLHTLAVVGAISLAYSAVALAVEMLRTAKRQLGLPHGYCVKLSLEMLLCPPVSANLVRRISLALAMESTFVSTARRLTPHAVGSKPVMG